MCCGTYPDEDRKTIHPLRKPISLDGGFPKVESPFQWVLLHNYTKAIYPFSLRGFTENYREKF
jgi:hypothetical protein